MNSWRGAILQNFGSIAPGRKPRTTRAPLTSIPSESALTNQAGSRESNPAKFLVGAFSYGEPVSTSPENALGCRIGTKSMWAYTVAEYARLRPYLPLIAGLFFLAGMACFLWAWLQGRKRIADRYKIVCEALAPVAMDASRRDWLARLATAARPEPIGQQQYLWHVLQQNGIVEGDFHEPGGLASGFEPALRKWLKEHPHSRGAFPPLR